MRQKTYFLNLLSLGVLSCFVFAFVLRVHFPKYRSLTLPSAEYSYDYSLEEALDPNQTCQFPNLNPYDPSIQQHLTDANPIRCNEHHYPGLTLVDDDGFLRFNATALRESGYRQSSLSCDYRLIIRDDGNDDGVRFGDPQPLDRDGQPMTSDFVSVSCRNFAGFTVYSNLHAHVLRKDGVTDRGRTPAEANKLSVFFFVLDSMSRSNFIRQLPKTYRYLVRDMEAVVLRGMTKVGDNTFPNLVPILTGKQVYFYPELLPLTGRDESSGVFDRPKRYDGWPFLWKNFSQLGYATLFAEDQPLLSLFNYLEGGFVRPPTDHYMRPFWLALESSSLHRFSANLCLGSTPKYVLHVDYVRRFLRAYRSAPYFGFSVHAELSHDFMNQVGAGDDNLHEFLANVHRNGSLDNTLFVVMGDHGHRLDSIVQTPVGSIERRMPFVAVYVPPRFRLEFPQATRRLKENAARLTSMRDLHFTVLDILELAGGGNGVGEHVRPAGGTTLFGPVPASRSCIQAGVPHQYCACDKEEAMDVEHPGVREAALALVASVNDLTAPHRTYCVPLELQGVRSAILMTSYGRANHSSKSDLDAWLKGEELRVRIVVEATPSGGIFEGIAVACANAQARVMTGINRVNLYGHQADCVPKYVRAINPQLREFCYCAGYT